MDAKNHSNSLRGPTSGRARPPRKERTAGGGDPREAVAVAIRAAFRSRIGEDRHDVWFGESFQVVAERDGDGERLVTVLAGSAFTHDWLQRTFRDDFVAAVEHVLGRSGGPTRVVWNPLVAGTDAADGMVHQPEAQGAGSGAATGGEAPAGPTPSAVADASRVQSKRTLSVPRVQSASK